jgi:hypothetical protein
MAGYDYVPYPQEAPLEDASDLKSVELGCFGLPQNSNCCTANDTPAPVSPGSALSSSAVAKDSQGIRDVKIVLSP